MLIRGVGHIRFFTIVMGTVSLIAIRNIVQISAKMSYACSGKRSQIILKVKRPVDAWPSTRFGSGSEKWVKNE